MNKPTFSPVKANKQEFEFLSRFIDTISMDTFRLLFIYLFF